MSTEDKIRRSGSYGKAHVTVGTWKQCAATFWGRTSGVFCTKADGHEGDHRGTGRQWNQAGERVAITEKLP